MNIKVCVLVRVCQCVCVCLSVCVCVRVGGFMVGLYAVLLQIILIVLPLHRRYIGVVADNLVCDNDDDRLMMMTM